MEMGETGGKFSQELVLSTSAIRLHIHGYTG